MGEDPRRCAQLCLPPLISSLDLLSPSAGTEAATLQPCQPGASWLGPQGPQERDHRIPLAPLNPSCTPKGHKLLLYPRGVAEQLKAACAVPEAEQRGAHPALQPPKVVGVQWEPQAPMGVQTPHPSLLPARTSGWKSTGPTSGHELLPGNPPNLHPGFCGTAGVPVEGGVGDAHPSGFLTLRKMVQHRLCLMLRATRSPHPQPEGRSGEGGGRAEPCCSSS